MALLGAHPIIHISRIRVKEGSVPPSACRCSANHESPVTITALLAKTLNMGTVGYDRRMFVFQKDFVLILENNC